MPVFFIWKAPTPNTSNKYITVYSGGDWSLEESDYMSNSYSYNDQISISNTTSSNILALSITKRPSDWIGQELLDTIKVPYAVLKDNDYGTYEHIGEWYRFVLKSHIDFEKDVLEKEFKIIKAIIGGGVTTIPQSTNTLHNSKYNTNNNTNTNTNSKPYMGMSRAMGRGNGRRIVRNGIE